MKRKSARAIRILTVALADRSPEVRARAAHALSGVKDVAAARALKKATRDPNTLVGITAAGEMLARNDTTNLPDLKLAARRQRNPRLRAAVIAALGKWRSKKALPLLAAGLKDRSPDVRYAAAMALAVRGDKRGVNELRGAVVGGRDDGEALRAMAALGVSQRDQLKTLARSKRARNRRNAMEAATDLLTPAAATAMLARGARDSDMPVRRTAARGLARLAPKVARAARLLRTLSRDADPAVRAIARLGLAKLTAKEAGKSPHVVPLKKAQLPERVVQPQRPPPKAGKKEQLFVDDSKTQRLFKDYHREAEIALGRGRFERAVNHLKRAARLTKQKAQAWCEIGVWLIKHAATRKDEAKPHRAYTKRARNAFLRCRKYRPNAEQRRVVRRGLADVRRLH